MKNSSFPNRFDCKTIKVLSTTTYIGLVMLGDMLLLTKNKRSCMHTLLITAILVIIHITLHITLRVFQLYTYLTLSLR